MGLVGRLALAVQHVELEARLHDRGARDREERADEAVGVLAGQQRSWPLALKPAALGGPLEVRAETQLGGLEATVALSGG